MKFLRLLLYPFSLIYAAVIMLRNAAYDTGLFKSRKFNLPLISIGNLSVGGSGKSPMAEYLIRLLKDKYRVATLSRGYGRKTNGFIELSEMSSAEEAGDEPVQFKHKFPSITVAVCEDRVKGIQNLERKNDLVIMDDAFQHRAVNPGLSLLLFDYNTISDTQYLLPAGNLREPLSGRKRADILVITKSPADLSEAERIKVTEHLKPYPHQRVFFSYLKYENLISFNDEQHIPLSEINKETKVVLLSGIANPYPLLNKLKQYTSSVIHHNYPDHHQFSTKNIAKLAAEWHKYEPEMLIITTEKDAQRLRSAELTELLKDLPVYYLPIRMSIYKPEEDAFNNIIKNYVAKHLQHN
jgi:tetraacyldisaccharide 4'-kinase